MNLRQLSRWSMIGAVLGIITLMLLMAHLALTLQQHVHDASRLNRAQHATAELGTTIARINSQSATAAIIDNARRELAIALEEFAAIEHEMARQAHARGREIRRLLARIESAVSRTDGAIARYDRGASRPPVLDTLLADLLNADAILRRHLSDLHQVEHQRLDQRLTTTLTLAGLAVLLFAGLGFFAFAHLHRRIHGPMQALMAGVRASGEGNFSERVPIVGRDEISELAIAFNAMLARLAAREEENRHYQQGLDRTLEERQAAIQEAREQARLLRKRVQELRCINQVTDILEDPERDFDEAMQSVVNVIPGGWRHAEFTVAHLRVEGRDYRTADYVDPVAQMQECIVVDNRTVGILKVGYRTEYPDADHGPFLAEERDLIHLVAGRIGQRLEQRSIEQTLRRLAYEDRLTGCSSRAGFNEALARRLVQSAKADRSDEHDWIILLDLHHFNDINQAFGHDCGNLLLKAVASRLYRATAPGGQLGRVGGDQFALAIARPADADADTVAAWVMDLFSESFQIQGHPIPLTVTIGLVKIDDPTLDSGEFMRRAQLAFHMAREQPDTSWVAYDDSVNQRSQERIRLNQDLEQAITSGEFELHFQPQIRLDSGEIISSEALLRWRHPRLGLLTPDAFILAAEHSKAILPIGEWVIEEACACLRRWRDGGRAAARTAINVSMAQFTDSDLAGNVERALERHRIEPNSLSLELTESLLEWETTVVLRQMERLRRLGVRLVLDDFGTGYSSLSHLDRYPFQEIKIDRLFVQRMTGHSYSDEIVHMIIRVAAALDCDLVAEGIETREQHDRLLELGCKVGQGFLFNRPLPMDAFEQLLRPHTP